ILQGDNKTPLTMNWNVTISEALPWRSVLEVSYVANKSQNEWIDGSQTNLGNLNNIYPGSFFLPDPVTGVNSSPNSPNCKNNGLDNNAYTGCNAAIIASYNN